MHRRSYVDWLGSIATLWMLASLPATADQCHLTRFPATPVTMEDLRPMIQAKINGVEARFIIDTGGFWSDLSPAALAKYKLFDQSTDSGLSISGPGGISQYTVATADNFNFLSVQFHQTVFIVEDFDYLSSSDAAGTIGENLLRTTDVEYDFANGLMRFVRPSHCDGRALAYWAGKQAIGVVDLRPTDDLYNFLIGSASVNGHEVHIMFDTGAMRSILSLAAAKRAGITPERSGVEPAGEVGAVGGRGGNSSWIAPIAEFQIGNEKITNTHVMVADFGMSWVDMILGSDFFLSHHVYVANSQNKLYFTYNGGPVFELGKSYLIRRAGSAPVLAGPDAAAPNPASSDQAGITAADSGSAGYMRLGMAYASERRYGLALANLDRGCRLDPKNPECLLQRGKVYSQDQQPEKALSDFDAAISLQPDLYRAHLERATLLVGWTHGPADATTRARADADFIDLRAPADSELRLRLADLYDALGEYDAAIREVSQWIRYHGEDINLASALNTRCWVRTEADRELDEALNDCNRALQLSPKSAIVLDSRGLVHLRAREFQLSIRDYDAALKVDPALPTSLYGRGMAKLGLGEKAAGESDLTAAMKRDAGVAARFARMGLSPDPSPPRQH